MYHYLSISTEGGVTRYTRALICCLRSESATSLEFLTRRFHLRYHSCKVYKSVLRSREWRAGAFCYRVEVLRSDKFRQRYDSRTTTFSPEGRLYQVIIELSYKRYVDIASGRIRGRSNQPRRSSYRDQNRGRHHLGYRKTSFIKGIPFHSHALCLLMISLASRKHRHGEIAPN